MPIATGKPRWMRYIEEGSAELMEFAPDPPWIGRLTAEEERRRAEEWARNMGTGYPSVRDASGFVDQHDQNPSSQAEGQKVESTGAGHSEASEDKKHEAED